MMVQTLPQASTLFCVKESQTRYKNSRVLESTIQLVQNRVAVSRHSLLQMFFGTRKMSVYFEVNTEMNQAKLSLLKLQLTMWLVGSIVSIYNHK